jgi:hypothetical protein
MVLPTLPGAATADPDYVDPVASTKPTPSESTFIPYTDLKITHEYDAIIETKSYITQVSKRWREIAIPFLYEDVRVRHRTVLQWFVQALKKSSSKMLKSPPCDLNEATHSYGYYTRRFALTLPKLGHRWRRGESERDRSNISKSATDDISEATDSKTDYLVY